MSGVRVGSRRLGRRWFGLAAALLLLALPSAAQDGADGVDDTSGVDSPAVELEQQADEEPASIGIDPGRVDAALDEIASTHPPDFCRRASHRLEPSEAALCLLAKDARAR
ncbi:MAG TPA: hypothetical protein VMG12_43315, partial [Polyangiaceae bacterium]|nr:hypothetical protein [Polyangiaceae bacterium]